MIDPDEYPYFDSSKEWNGIGSVDPEVAAVQKLTQELEAYGRAVNADYADMLSDRHRVEIGDSDTDDEVETRVVYEVYRVRDTSPIASYDTIAECIYSVTSSVSYAFKEREKLPAFVLEMFEGTEYVQTLLDVESEVGILFEQTFTLSTEGTYERAYRLAFAAGGEAIEVLNDEMNPQSFRDKLASFNTPEESGVNEWEMQFSEEQLLLLNRLGLELAPKSRDVPIIHQMYEQAARIIDVEPAEQLQMVRNLLAQMPGYTPAVVQMSQA